MEDKMEHAWKLLGVVGLHPKGLASLLEGGFGI